MAWLTKYISSGAKICHMDAFISWCVIVPIQLNHPRLSVLGQYQLSERSKPILHNTHSLDWKYCFIHFLFQTMKPDVKMSHSTFLLTGKEEGFFFILIRNETALNEWGLKNTHTLPFYYARLNYLYTHTRSHSIVTSGTRENQPLFPRLIT